MASPSRKLERFLFIFVSFMVHLPAVLLHNHCSSNFNVTYGREVIIEEGGRTCLFCDYPTSRLTPEWYRGTSVITDGELPDPCDCEIDDMNARVLCFDSITMDAVGDDYSCQVQIGIGQVDECPFSVTLAVQPSITSPAAMTSYNLTANSNSPPTLTIPLVVERGLPPATINWTKDDVTISQETTLTVPNIDADDRGIYRVTLTNIAGTATRDFKVFVRFLQVQVTPPAPIDNGMYEVVCEMIGYPQLSFVEWTTGDGQRFGGTSTETNRATFEDRITSRLIVSRDECMASGGYTCAATTMNGNRELSSSTSGCAPSMESEIRVSSSGETGVRVQWTEDTTLDRIEYRLLPDGQPMSVPVEGGMTSLEIQGLVSGSSYEFRAKLDGADVGEPVRFTVQCTNNPLVSTAPSNIRANTMINNNERVITISWDSLPTAARYRLHIRISNGIEATVELGDDTTYTLPSDEYPCTNNLDYTLTVQGLNQCSTGGPNSTSVNVACPAQERRIEIFSTTTFNTAITIQWVYRGESEAEPDEPPMVSALQKRVIDGEQYRLNYSTTDRVIPAFCMKGLMKDTLYEVCLSATFGGDKEVVCVFAMTRNDDTETKDLSTCHDPFTVESVISTVSTPTNSFPDYAIAVIVVGVLGIIALIFCFIGLCFACHSSKQKEVDFGSTSSLQAPSEPMHNHRSMSPSRSCLSYHTKGHSTNWSDHVDTLRQMETDTGTHV